MMSEQVVRDIISLQKSLTEPIKGFSVMWYITYLWSLAKNLLDFLKFFINWFLAEGLLKWKWLWPENWLIIPLLTVRSVQVLVQLKWEHWLLSLLSMTTHARLMPAGLYGLLPLSSSILTRFYSKNLGGPYVGPSQSGNFSFQWWWGITSS